MELIELVSNELFRFPIRRDATSIIRIIGNKFDAYINLLNKLHNKDKFTDTIVIQISDIEHLCNKLIKTHKQFLKGSPYKAYNEFSDGISNLEDFFLSGIRERVRYPEYISLFRIRSSNCRYLSLRDIFHIPFESRGKVRNQRYSINGFPCLYLGSSIYVCWEELNRPSFSDIFISRFRLLTKRPGILYLTFSMDEAKRAIQNFKEDDPYCEWLLYRIVDKIVIFPLIACCSIINKGNSDVFKEEYIIPQILLEWARNNNKINAIEYSSLSLPDYSLDHSLYRNYVFPAKRQKMNGHCTYLSSIFEFTEPVSWDLAMNLCGPTKDSSSTSMININLVKQERSYNNTLFGQMEKFIDSLPFQKLG